MTLFDALTIVRNAAVPHLVDRRGRAALARVTEKLTSLARKAAGRRPRPGIVPFYGPVPVWSDAEAKRDPRRN